MGLITPHTDEWMKTYIWNFTIDEFSENPLIYSDPDTFSALQEFRSAINVSITPSKATGAVARFDKVTTQHYYNKESNRYSKAFDIFVNTEPAYVLYKLLTVSQFTGIGVYFDVKNNLGVPQVMFHVDTRMTKLLWYRENNKYYYANDITICKELFKKISTVTI